MATELWFHGSNDPDLRITPGAKSGGPVDFGAIFFLRNYRLASEYIWRKDGAVYGYEIDMGRVFTSPNRGSAQEIEDAFHACIEEYRAWSLPDNDEDFELVRDLAVWDQSYCLEEEETLARIFGVDVDEAGWMLQKFRLCIARRLGYIGASMTDEHGSVAILAEFLPERLQRFDHDPEEDEEAYSEEERAEYLAAAADALATAEEARKAAEEALRYADELTAIGQEALDRED